MTSNASEISPRWQIEVLDSPIDGGPIRYGTWQAGTQKPSWGVLFLNGRSEWIEKYDFLPEEMNLGDDVLWVTLDHRGQGASTGTRAHVETYEHFARDAAAVAAHCFEDRPYYVMTHSMGGLVALTAMARGWLHPRAAALCSPLLALPHQPIHRTIARPLAHFISKSTLKIRSTGVKPQRDRSFHSNSLTHSHQGFQRIVNSPYAYQAPTFGWVHATFEACAFIFAAEVMKQLKCPIKIIYGSEEKVVDPSVYAAWCERAHQQTALPVDLARIPGGKHELLNEVPRLRSAAENMIKNWFSTYS